MDQPWKPEPGWQAVGEARDSEPQQTICASRLCLITEAIPARLLSEPITATQKQRLLSRKKNHIFMLKQ
jgi:hypothetical protein